MKPITLKVLIDLYEQRKIRTVYQTLRKRNEKYDMGQFVADDRKIILNWSYFRRSKVEILLTMCHELIHMYFVFGEDIKKYMAHKKIENCFNIDDSEFIVEELAKKVLIESDITSMKRLISIIDKVKNVDKKRMVTKK